MGQNSPYVLCVGYRQQLAKALANAEIPYSVLSDKALKKRPAGVDQVIIAEYPRSEKSLKTLELHLSESEVRPTHVIAGTEAAVFPASFIRKYFHARASEQTLIRRCSSKAEMKLYLSKKDVPMTKFVIGTGKESAKELVDYLGLPVVVKKFNESGGRGMHICESAEELGQHLGKNQLYEAFINASEGSVESFVNRGEILFTNVTEYFEKGFSNIVPASYSQGEIKDILELNKQVIQKLKINWGMTHLEFYRHKDGLLFGEIALRPPGGYIMQLMEEAYGFNPWEAFLNVEIDRDMSFPKKAKTHAACWVHHPGVGQVRDVKMTVNLQSLKKHKIKVKAGDRIAMRSGVGEDVGYSLFVSDDVNVLKKDLASQELQSVIQIEESF